MRSLFFGLVLVLILVTTPSPNVAFAAGKDLGNIGIHAKWTKIEISITGPDSTSAGTTNPFGYPFEVTFESPSGRMYTVPGFYAGDGNGGPDGKVWQVRFSADETGTWTFSSTSAESLLDRHTGSFAVIDPGPDAPDFYKWGRLEYVGTATNKLRYLKFRDGPYWLKAGCDDPENFLGNFSNYDTDSERKNSVDYLANKGVNSMYMMTHNIEGDNQDVWPWLGNTTSLAKSNGGSNARFDIAKLEEWRELFEYMQNKGVVPYLILEDDSAWKGYDHQRYYRELIARFGYLPALIFNIGEESDENYSLSQALSYAQQLKDIDPYDHPVGIHNVNDPNSTYINAAQVDFTSIQTKGSDPLEHNDIVIDWIDRCKSLGKRLLMVNFDEPRPLLDRKGWWSAYLGGGVWEVHTEQPYDRPMSTWEEAWTEIGGARTFMESLPFWEMEPKNDLLTSGTAFCLAKPGEVYALYAPSGGTVTVDLVQGHTYAYKWWDPSNGRNGKFQNEGNAEGGQQTFSAPGSGDWALIINRSPDSQPVKPMKVATGAYPDLAVDSSGNVHLVYARGGKMWYRHYNAATRTWSDEQDTGISQYASYRNDPDIVVDSLNRPHVVGGQDNGTGQYGYWNGGKWEHINGSLNRDTALAIDSADNIYIIDRGGNNGGYLGLVRRDAGASIFTTLPDPDVADGLPLGQNDHVYGHVFVNHVDDSVHVVYRHAAPTNCSYRASEDGGRSWLGGGLSGDDAEAPSGCVGPDGTIYAVTGGGTVYKRTDRPSSWSSLGSPISAGSRHLPSLSTDDAGNLYVSGFGGEYNVRSSNSWIGKSQVSSVSGSPIGFMKVAGAPTFCYAVWEEGPNVLPENDNSHDSFDIVFATIASDGSVGADNIGSPPTSPTSLRIVEP